MIQYSAFCKRYNLKNILKNHFLSSWYPVRLRKNVSNIQLIYLRGQIEIRFCYKRFTSSKKFEKPWTRIKTKMRTTDKVNQWIIMIIIIPHLRNSVKNLVDKTFVCEFIFKRMIKNGIISSNMYESLCVKLKTWMTSAFIVSSQVLSKSKRQWNVAIENNKNC